MERTLRNDQIVYRKQFSGEYGKYMLEDLEWRFHIHSETTAKIEGQPIDEKAMLIREGQRQVVLYIKNLLQGDLVEHDMGEDEDYEY